MSNSLTVYEKFADPLAAIQTLGNDIAKSGMFGCSTMEQGRVFALECFSRKMPPLTLADRYHVIFGKLSLKADTMLAEFNDRGGKHRVLIRTADKAEIELSLAGETQRFSLTWEDAQREPFVYAGKEESVLEKLAAGDQPKIKAKYQTPRSRMQMLWARVVSDGVRTMCPSVNSGCYTPEEISDIADSEDGDHGSNGNGQAKASTVVDVVSVTTNGSESSQTATAPAATAEPTGTATGEQVSAIKTLYAELQIPIEVQQGALSKRGVSSLFSLPATEAQSILEKLQAKKADLQGQTAQQTAAAEQAPVTHQRLDAPCSVEQSEKARQLIVELNQTKPGIAAKIKAKLQEAGLSKIADLTIADCDKLLRLLELKQIEQFFELSLAKATNPN